MQDIKTLRSELKSWGFFWARQEEGQGWPSKSPTYRLKETCQVGRVISSDLHLFSDGSDGVFIPQSLEYIDTEIGKLSIECKKALRQRYVLRGIVLFDSAKTFKYWLRVAENRLL